MLYILPLILQYIFGTFFFFNLTTNTLFQKNLDVTVEVRFFFFFLLFMHKIKKQIHGNSFRTHVQ